jgi:hypothetical protein
MTFDFVNDRHIGEKMFPNNCNFCGERVLFLPHEEAFPNKYNTNPDYFKDKYVYICEGCGAYVKAHSIDKGSAIKYYPQGILTDEKLRNAHALLNLRFEVLHQAPHTKIKQIYKEYIRSFTDPDGETRLGKVDHWDREKDVYTLSTELGEVFEVCTTLTQSVNLRTKSYFWLACKMRVPISHCQIPMFDLEETSRALDYVEEALKSVGINETETIPYEINN